ncbi:S1 family peptidase [Bdellovibrio sp. HCB288]|uniref:S1 family peptidase n=1 Tax=Bdellovibrio sp. HCB288 TaxID=3394355 RepID=UPI0039B47C78
MKILNLLTILVLLSSAACTQVSQETLRARNSELIIGGKRVTKDSPIGKSTVGIYDVNTTMICTGVLLENNIILTAAHCLTPNLDETFVVFAKDMDPIIEDYDLLHKSPLTRRTLAAIVHSDFKVPEEIRGTNNPANDIALLKFKGSIPKGYKPARMLTTPALLKVGLSTIIAGYGVESDEVTEIDTTQTEDLQALLDEGAAICYFDDDANKERCFSEELSGPAVLKSTSVKVGSFPNPFEAILLQDKTNGPCLGDSGGPAFIKSGSEYLVWGITSRGDLGCSTRTFYTNIHAYKTWIIENSARLTPIK